ncbi:MAG: sulfatase-like hydrolase/transferase [Candidatus Lokiarchaeota archaeon]|nr:sulfatase-like hydrolase/transferase [Candidatus Lokiarchaeota archaeon]MBD3338020.1 sulfatase-like hydrolase/transferase [Candidatus Lokiarchaeota archaeon]
MSEKPNIIYILNDHQAFYGHGEMAGSPKIQRPNIEKLGNEGVKFTRAYTACPLCGPARRTMLTGLFPHNHGEIKNETNHKYDRELYLSKLAEGGYKNYYFGKWHAGRGLPHDFQCEGFSCKAYGNPYITPEYKEYIKKHDLPDFEVRIKHSFMDPKSNYTTQVHGIIEGALYKPDFVSLSTHTTGLMTTPKETHEAYFLAYLACEKLKEIAKSDNQEPFHMRIDFWGPHQPYFTTQDFLDLYDPKEIKQLPSFDENLKKSNKPEIYQSNFDYPISEDGKLIYPNPVPWEVWQEVLAYNYAQQTLVDEAAGRILDTLEELGLSDNTLVIYSTDHGDAVGCHGGHFDKDSYMPEEMMRIPMVLRYPGVVEEKQVSDKLVSNIDLAPTFLDAAGLKFSEPVDGRSLLPISKTPESEWREDLMCETHGHYILHNGRMLVTDRYKYVWNEDDLDELYDLKEDPFELNNLINLGEYKDILDDLKKRLTKWRDKTGDIVDKSMIYGKRLKIPR